MSKPSINKTSSLNVFLRSALYPKRESVTEDLVSKLMGLLKIGSDRIDSNHWVFFLCTQLDEDIIKIISAYPSIKRAKVNRNHNWLIPMVSIKRKCYVLCSFPLPSLNPIFLLFSFLQKSRIVSVEHTSTTKIHILKKKNQMSEATLFHLWLFFFSWRHNKTTSTSDYYTNLSYELFLFGIVFYKIHVTYGNFSLLLMPLHRL